MTFRKIQIFSLIGIISLGILIHTGCKKNNDDDEDIPYVYVNFTINPSSIEYNNLEIVGNYAYVTGGFRGIIIYHATQDEYKAYERTSPYNYPNDFECRVNVDDSGLIAIDSCSGSKYILLDGSPFEGPATKSLKPYHTSFNGTLLHVYN